MKIIILIFLSITIAHTVNAQSKAVETGNTNLFAYGMDVNDSKANFINLFWNFPMYIENANEMKLMYYQYIGILKNAKEIKHYIKRNYPPYVPSWGISRVSGEESNRKYSRIRFSVEDEPFTRKIEYKFKMNNLLKNYIHVGDEVWEITFRLWEKVYHYYIFIDSKTKTVIEENNLFGLRIPLSHINIINSGSGCRCSTNNLPDI